MTVESAAMCCLSAAAASWLVAQFPAPLWGAFLTPSKGHRDG